MTPAVQKERPPEFRVSVTIRNNLLMERREALGLSAAALCRAAGIATDIYSGFETLRISPRGSRGWKIAALRLAAFHKTLPEDLWPDVVLSVGSNRVEQKVAARDVIAMCYPERIAPSPAEIGDREELRRLLTDRLATLTEREQRVVVMSFGLDGNGDRGLEEIGDAVGLSAERVRQIILGALRRLRNPSLTRDLLPFLEK